MEGQVFPSPDFCPIFSSVVGLSPLLHLGEKQQQLLYLDFSLMSLSRAVFTARTASRVMLKNNIVARASTAKFSSYFKFPPIPEDGVYRRPTIAPPTRPVCIYA